MNIGLHNIQKYTKIRKNILIIKYVLATEFIIISNDT